MDDHEKLKVVIRANSQVAVFGSGGEPSLPPYCTLQFPYRARFAFFPLLTDSSFFYSHFLGDII
jgi:hypothetical protein